GDVTLSAEGGALSGLIYSPEGVYEIVPQEGFTHLLVQIDQSRFPPCAGTLPQQPDADASDAAPSSAKSSVVLRPSASDAPTAPDDGSMIDVLVVYTSNVRTALGGTAQADTFAQSAINSTNTAYINSQINTRLRLAGTFEASYTEAGTLSAALTWVRTDSGVAAARDSVKADLVAFIVENASDGCGLAYVMQNVGNGFAGSAFSSVARQCAVGNLSFAHELGHNEGCEHNPENGAPPSSASYPYAYGHWVDNTFRTVMSYTDPCTNGNCPRIAYFSNPSVNFNGVATGIADARDNHRVINNTALTVSQFRNSNVQPPANDNFANAQSVSGDAGSYLGTNVGATKESGEPAHAGNAGGSSVWFTWQAPSSGRLTLMTAGSNFDTLLAAYTGTSLGSLTQVASNDDASNIDKTSTVNFKVTAGTVYRIAVDGWNGESGNVTLTWLFTQRPANDDFVDAVVLSGASGTVTGSSVNGTKESGEPTSMAGNAGGASVWYSWTAPSNGALTLTTAGSGFNTLLAVYNGNSVSSLSNVASNDDAGGGLTTSSVTFNVNAGTTYRIAVDGSGGATGNVTLSWSLGAFCTYSVTAANASFPGTGGGSTFSVTAPATCPWTASAGFNSWINITSGASGTGNGTAGFTVAANPNTTSRLGSVTVNGIAGAPMVFFNVFEEASASSTIQLGAVAYSVNESERKVQINVTRTGDTSGAASVSYATSDASASRLRDYTQTLGTLSFAANETTKTVTVFVTDDVYQESPETFNFTLSNAAGTTLGSPSSAVVTITSDDAQTGANPVADASFNPDFFVRQHYIDFLGREADAPGLAFWTNQTTNCASPPPADPAVCRVNVSQAFFLSIEFQNTGFYAYRTYKAAYGDMVDLATGLSVPAIRLDEFLTDTKRIGQGVVVGNAGWDAQLDANKQAYALEFVQSQRFALNYPPLMSPAAFVDRLRSNTGAALSQTERDALVAELTANNTNAGRASVLRKVAEDADLQAAEKSRAFVLMQYFGYLRRNLNDPPNADYTGWKFWLDKLNQFNGDAVAAEMVKAFITSDEYRQRFGP
ncbi:MAG TPA: M12 family metallo-peptidase, partial [Pyrinomonadaceae bacterium]|nr:M12 family metallo-peptidase [Pyrinomonadaceae bacterium]